MADTGLDRLSAAVDALSSAIDIDDIHALEGAIASVPPALEALAIPGAWTHSPETRALVKALDESLELARRRIAVLGDLGRRRLDLLALAGVATGTAITYGRQARSG